KAGPDKNSPWKSGPLLSNGDLGLPTLAPETPSWGSATGPVANCQIGRMVKDSPQVVNSNRQSLVIGKRTEVADQGLLGRNVFTYKGIGPFFVADCGHGAVARVHGSVGGEGEQFIPNALEKKPPVAVGEVVTADAPPKQHVAAEHEGRRRTIH